MNTYFQSCEGFYRQKHSCAMGSPVSPFVANLYMDEVESRAMITLTETAPSYWFGHVDYTWVKIRPREMEAFTEHIHAVDSNINFTWEDVRGGRNVFILRTKHPGINRVVNAVQCSQDCTDLYTGDTKKKPLHKGMAQHRGAISPGQDSAALLHLKKKKNHSLADISVNILSRGDKWFERGIKESMCQMSNRNDCLWTEEVAYSIINYPSTMLYWVPHPDTLNTM